MSLISFSTLCVGLCKRKKFKLGLRSFLFKFERKPVVQKLAMEVGNRKGGKAGSGLVWREPTFCRPFYLLATADSVIAKIISSSRWKDVQTRLYWKFES